MIIIIEADFGSNSLSEEQLKELKENLVAAVFKVKDSNWCRISRTEPLHVSKEFKTSLANEQTKKE